MLRVVILPLAKQDVKNAVEWYDAKQKGLGARFAQDLRSKVSFVCKNPNAYAVRYDSVRCAIMDVFPFMIHFSINQPEKLVVIAAVFHTSLSPKQWEERKVS